MEFTPRLQKMLLFMLEKEEKVSIKQLADTINVSKRTAQRELEYIDSSLKKYHIKFQSKTGSGVWLEGTDEDKELLLQDLTQDSRVDMINRNERRKRLVLEMLKERMPQKLYYYSNLFGVSEATISTDMDSIKEWFKQFDLKIVRRQGYGVALEGSEKDYRRAVRSFIGENINTKMIREIYDSKEEIVRRILRNAEGMSMYAILDQDILKRVVNCFFELNDPYLSNLTENSYIGLILHVTIAINRILKKEIIEENTKLLQGLTKDEEYESAICISEALADEFKIEIPSIEIAYIWLHLKGAKQQYLEIKAQTEGQETSAEQKKLLELLDKMIDAYDNGETAYALKQDDEFIQGILAHLSPTLVRIKNGMSISNPLLEQIKQDYAAIYEKCKKVAGVLEKELNCELPEAEIGFLAIHFGAAIVRMDMKKEESHPVNVGVVCASGIGISQLMCIKIKKVFQKRVKVTAYGTSDITPYIEEKTDFFVSNIPLEAESSDVLYVSPLLIEEDMREMEKRVYKYERCAREKKEEIFTLQLEQVNYIAFQIKTIIKEVFCLKTEQDITLKELLERMTEKITPHRESQKIIQEDIYRREKLSSQIFPEFGFGLLHTKTKGVAKPSFSACLTKELGAFQDDYFKQITVIIMMLMPDDENSRVNGDILGYLSGAIIEKPEFLETIQRGETEAIRERVSQYLKQYFNKYLDKMQ